LNDVLIACGQSVKNITDKYIGGIVLKAKRSKAKGICIVAACKNM